MNQKNEESIDRWISLIHRYGNVYLSEKFKEHHLGTGQYQFLAILYNNEGLSQDDLTNILKMDKGTTAKVVSELEENGYIERKTFSLNKRVKKIYLTEQAHACEPMFHSILQGWQDVLFKRFFRYREANGNKPFN